MAIRILYGWKEEENPSSNLFLFPKNSYWFGRNRGLKSMPTGRSIGCKPFLINWCRMSGQISPIWANQIPESDDRIIIENNRESWNIAEIWLARSADLDSQFSISFSKASLAGLLGSFKKGSKCLGRRCSGFNYIEYRSSLFIYLEILYSSDYPGTSENLRGCSGCLSMLHLKTRLSGSTSG